jgi:hypothetical protein
VAASRLFDFLGEQDAERSTGSEPCASQRLRQWRWGDQEVPPLSPRRRAARGLPTVASGHVRNAADDVKPCQSPTGQRSGYGCLARMLNTV